MGGYMTRDECKKRLEGRIKKVLQHQFCAYSHPKNKNHVEVCKGDSGGPLVYIAKKGPSSQWPDLYQQVGAVSFGIDCTKAGDENERQTPGVYSKITKFMK